MPSPIKKIFFGNYIFDIWENVYEPAEDSFLFAENLTVKEDESVLDMGTGCGILGILASEKASRVIAVDVNPYAVRCAKENSKLNSVAGKMLFVRGDLFRPLRTEDKFDLILFNAPYLPTEYAEDGSWLACAWTGGASGRQVIDRFIREAPKHVGQDGRIFLMQSTLSDVNDTLKGFAEAGLKARIIAQGDLPFFETLGLVEAKR